MGKKDKLKDKIKAAKKTKSKKTILMREAAASGNLSDLQSAVHGIDKDEIDNHDEDETVGVYSALMLACMNGHPTCVTYLLSHHAVLEQTDVHTLTCLMWAAINGHRDVVKLLMKYRVDLNAKDVKGHTALHWAAMKGSHRVIPLLLHSKLSHYSSPKTSCNINITTRDGYTPLALAIQHQQWKCVDVLLQEGANIQIIPTTYTHLPDASLLDCCRDDIDRSYVTTILDLHTISHTISTSFHETSSTSVTIQANVDIIDIIISYAYEKPKKPKIKKHGDEKEKELSDMMEHTSISNDDHKSSIPSHDVS